MSECQLFEIGVVFLQLILKHSSTDTKEICVPKADCFADCFLAFRCLCSTSILP